MKTSQLGNFLENHDHKRFGNLNGDMALAKNAIAFTMLMDGIPTIYQGQEQHFSGGSDPDNRQGLWTSGYSTKAELYTWFALLNRIRALAIAKDQAYVPFQAAPIWSDDHAVAMKKAQVVSVFTNIGVGPARFNVSLPANGTGYSAGQEIVDLAAPGCSRYRTSSNGGLAFEMGSAPKVLYPAAMLSRGDLCFRRGSYGPPTGLSAGLSANLDSTSTWPRPNQVDRRPVCYVTFNQTRTTSFGDAVKMYVLSPPAFRPLLRPHCPDTDTDTLEQPRQQAPAGQLGREPGRGIRRLILHQLEPHLGCNDGPRAGHDA